MVADDVVSVGLTVGEGWMSPERLSAHKAYSSLSFSLQHRDRELQKKRSIQAGSRSEEEAQKEA